MKCGIVDVGSNTVQLSVYHYDGGAFRLLLNRWETVGLMGYVEGGCLSTSGVAAVCRVLGGFRALLRDLEVPTAYIFATASLRNLSNTEEVLTDIGARTGFAVDILSGEEEAACSFRGILSEGAAPAGLMADIGGGSTELVTWAAGARTGARSLPVGALSLYKKYVGDLFPTAEEQLALRRRVLDELERTGGPPPLHASLTGVGGTVRAVVKLCNVLAKAEPDRRIVSAEEVGSLLNTLSVGGRSALDLILPTAPERVHTLLPGLVILDCILTATRAETLTVSNAGVREGYLLRRVMAQ